MILGFKCFNQGLKNAFGEQLILDKKYVYDGPIKFRYNGFHICVNLEDTLRYFDGFHNEVDICEAIGYPRSVLFEDEYNGYYDMYACQGLILTKLLTRTDILNRADAMNENSFRRFAMGYRLTKEELDYFKNKYRNNINVLEHLIYYYEDKTIYSKKIKR